MVLLEQCVSANLAYSIPRPVRCKVGKMPSNKHICHASGIYREIMENTGKYDLQSSTFKLVISIIEVKCFNISYLLVYQAIR